MPGSTISINAPVASNFPQNVATASNIDELLASCPRTYQPAMGPLFRKFSDIATKASHAQNTLSNFESHIANSSFPPAILGSFKVPTVQVTKEFDGSSARQSWTADMETNLYNVRRSALEQCITLKKEEHSFLLSLLADSETRRQATEAYTKVWTSLSPTFSSGINAKGAQTFTGFFVEEYTFIKAHANDMCRKAVAIGFAKHQRELVAKMGKLRLKKDTDTSMSDMAVNDIQKTIEQAVAKALRARTDKKPKQKITKPLKRGSPNAKRPRPTIPKGKAQTQGRGKGNGVKKQKRS